jgi:hypothetical protein
MQEYIDVRIFLVGFDWYQLKLQVELSFGERCRSFLDCTHNHSWRVNAAVALMDLWLHFVKLGCCASFKLYQDRRRPSWSLLDLNLNRPNEQQRPLQLPKQSPNSTTYNWNYRQLLGYYFATAVQSQIFDLPVQVSGLFRYCRYKGKII